MNFLKVTIWCANKDAQQATQTEVLSQGILKTCTCYQYLLIFVKILPFMQLISLLSYITNDKIKEKAKAIKSKSF